MTGNLDPIDKKTSAAMLKMSTKFRQPKTQTVSIQGDW